MKVISITKTNKLSTVTVNDEVFGAKPNNQLLSQAVRVYKSNKRQGTSKVKTRGEVTGSRRKIWKQKGTGNARHGAKSAPIFVGGGVAHGPTGLENWTLKLSRHMKKKALITALSMQADNVFVSDNLSELSGKTKEAAMLLNSLKISGKKVLVVTENKNELIQRSFSNIQRTEVIESSLVNALNVASADSIIISKESVKALEARLLSKPEKSVKPTRSESVEKVAPKKTAVKKPAVKKAAPKKTAVKKAAPKKVAKKSTKVAAAKKA